MNASREDCGRNLRAGRATLDVVLERERAVRTDGSSGENFSHYISEAKRNG